MSQDGPRDVKPKFTFRAARNAGLPFFSVGSEVRQELDAVLAQHSNLSRRVNRMRKDGRKSPTILRALREGGYLGSYKLEKWFDTKRERPAVPKYGRDRAALIEEASWAIDNGHFKAACLWKLRKGNWVVIKEFSLSEQYSQAE